MDKKLSSAIQLVTLVWNKSFSARSHSWAVYNDCLQTALSLAIKSGMEFYPDDFKYISDNFNFGYWAGNDGHMQGERYYFEAIREGNTQAALSFEVWKNRKPFIYENISHAWKSSLKERKQSRVFVNAQFMWHGEKVAVTSFAENGKYFIACSYHEKKKCGTCGWLHCANFEHDTDTSRTKVKRQYKITHADIKKARAENKIIAKIREAVYDGFSRINTNFYNRIVELFWLTFQKENTTELDFFRMLAGLPHNANKQ